MNNYNFYIGTTRFNTFTFEENKKWREKHTHNGCIYPTNKRIAESIRLNSLVFVLEMNNDINKIMGIGLVRNKINHDDKALINFTDRHYNKYIYHSAYRIDASEFTEKQKKYIEILELIAFKGYRHFKRGNGITIIKWERFKTDETKSKFISFFRKLF